jgi:multicomponent Na+:H+ antiporter subunit E
MLLQLLAFTLLVLSWIVLSGKFDGFHLLLGILSALVVTMWSGSLLFQDKEKSVLRRGQDFFRFVPYVFWLLYEIVLANFHVVYVALHPNMKALLAPQMVIVKTNLKKDLSKFVFANSITLTPGTVTVRIDDQTILVHALTKQTAQGVPGEMEKKVASVFGEDI